MTIDLPVSRTPWRRDFLGTSYLAAAMLMTGLCGCADSGGIQVGDDGAGQGGTGGAGKGGAGGSATGAPDSATPTDATDVGGNNGGTTGTGGVTGAGGLTGAGGATAAGGVSGAGGATAPGGMSGTGGSSGVGGIRGSGGVVIVKADGALPDAPADLSKPFGQGGAGGARADGPSGPDLPSADLPSADLPSTDLPRSSPDGAPGTCNVAVPDGSHLVHFRYLWAGQKTFTYFPKPALMPPSIQLEVGSNQVTCAREADRPWFACPVPDAYFKTGATWRAVDQTHTPVWTTVAPYALPPTPKEYWIRWYYGRPDIPRVADPPVFKIFDYYPDAGHGNWAATGKWNDAACPALSGDPGQVGFGSGGWFPYQRTLHRYPFGASLAYLYEDAAAVQDAFDAFVFERYQLWKQNYIKYDSDACGTGTARVRSDPPETVSEGQGYGIAIAAAIGDKNLFDKLWSFVRHYRSQAKYCGLVGWMWQGSADCQALDSFAAGSGNTDSAFDGDVDVGIGLVYAALQWPEYTDAATDWLVRMECEINTKYGDGWSYPTVGDSWNKTCSTAGGQCDYAPGTKSSVFLDYYPPGYFRAFGDFLAAHPPASGATAANGRTHRDFWFKTAETVWEMVERCYDESGVHPGLMGNQGTIDQPCSAGAGQPYEWARALWRLGIDAAWFGNDQSLPENQPSSSLHYPGKSRMEAKLDNIQRFYTSFHQNNPPEANANRFSTLCDQLGTDGAVRNCDPAYGHHAYTVNMAMCGYASYFDDEGATSNDIRREAIEEAINATIEDDKYFQESLGVYSLLFLTGNFPNPMAVTAP